MSKQGTVTIEFIECDGCDHEVAMVFDRQAARIQFACECTSESFPMTEYWIGDLPPEERLPPEWHRKPAGSTTDRSSRMECRP